jgi:hypothetical protein
MTQLTEQNQTAGSQHVFQLALLKRSELSKMKKKKLQISQLSSDLHEKKSRNS